MNPMQTQILAGHGVPAPQNETWGFWGTLTNTGAAPELVAQAWAKAVKALIDGLDPVGAIEVTPEQARDILDAKVGRHLADALVTSRGTIMRAVAAKIDDLIGLRQWEGSLLAAIELKPAPRVKTVKLELTAAQASALADALAFAQDAAPSEEVDEQIGALRQLLDGAMGVR
jgi:hypothetical protein